MWPTQQYRDATSIVVVEIVVVDAGCEHIPGGTHGKKLQTPDPRGQPLMVDCRSRFEAIRSTALLGASVGLGWAMIPQ